ncbi:MAG: outer membrane protein assembly factor BamD, partial [Alphaproteobacteria bacterium]|nr:outer membrane protein assembly factor BamD [Alphaproteobacteria bacterium]
MKKLCGLLSGILVVSACSSSKDLTNLPATDLYNVAFEDLEATKYKAAAAEFEQVETDHPYSRWAVKAKLMGAYAYYKDEKYDDAVMALDRFIQYHPGNKDIAYAYYLRGMCYYDQIAAADKDQGNTEMAEATFARLIALFPDSKYAEDARQKIKLTTDYRAGQEMIIGRYYLNEGNYLSALSRFNVVLENYQTTIQIEEALYRQVEIYGILGMNKYADGYYKILKQNYPDGTWTAKAAAIMEKIGTQDPTAKSKAEKKAEEEKSGGWFDWMKFGSDDAEKAAETKTEEAKKTAEKKVEEEKSGGWF